MNIVLKNLLCKMIPCVGLVALAANSTYAQIMKSNPGASTRAEIVTPPSQWSVASQPSPLPSVVKNVAPRLAN